MSYEPTEYPPELSAAGQRRRDSILALATDEAAAMRRRRSARRTTGVAALALCAAVSAVVIVQGPPSRPPGEIARPTPDPAPGHPQPSVGPVASKPSDDGMAHVVAAPRAEVIIQTLRTDPTLVERMAVPRTIGGWETIGTDELLREFQNNGLAGGVVVRDGRPTIWFRPTAGE